MGEDERINLAGQLQLINQKIDHLHESLCPRVKFLEKITFGAIGVVVLGVLASAGGALLWVLAHMGWHQGD